MQYLDYTGKHEGILSFSIVSLYWAITEENNRVRATIWLHSIVFIIIEYFPIGFLIYSRGTMCAAHEMSMEKT